MPEPVSTVKELMTLGFVLLAIALSGLICRFLKVSPFIGYLIIGVSSQTFVGHHLSFSILSKIGIILLFFHIGSTVTWKAFIRSPRNLMLIVLDFLLNFVVPFSVLIMFKYTAFEAALISTILYPTSSVMTISKIIQQRRSGYPETEVIVWMLIGEDLIIIILMTAMMQFRANFEVKRVLFGIIFLFVMTMVGILFSKRIGNLYSRIPKEDKAVFLFGLAFASGVLAYRVGFSEALGAFLFGMLFSGLRGLEEVERQMSFLRELGIAFFFFLFGLQASFSMDFKVLALALGVLVFSVWAKWLTGTIGGKLAGLGKGAQKRLAFSLWTRGEFSMLFLWTFLDTLPTLWVEVLSLFLISSVFLGLIGCYFLKDKSDKENSSS